ncbi:DVUA0089 family protein [Limnoglobus roseus]|uniref:DVUA0089 family protein n=1 Tax=Limnoglobus roseus TaxID=2598579 RepID=UPI00143CEFFA|nr:DVUA0089 family protein [Limnoglobus roseus]
MPSWGSTPPSAVAVPTSYTPVTLNTAGDATGAASVATTEVDWYRFTVTTGGSFTISATTPTSNLDTVIGLYTSTGQRVTYNDDISSTNYDSRFTRTLSAGTYLLGVTNYTGTAGGTYTWAIDGPATTVPPPPPPPPTSPPTTGGFSITLQTNGLTANQLFAFQQAAARWSQVITGDLPDANYNGTVVDDVLISASAVAIDGAGGVLGQAGPDRLRAGSYLPYHGTMQFDSADLAQLEASGQLASVVIHEMGHVLGIGTIWQQKGLVSGIGTTDPRFLGAQATAQYNAIFGTSGASVPVENSGGSGTAGGHWRESVFGNELMTGYLNAGFNPLSRVTVGALADMGYAVNLGAADAYTPPAGTAALVAGGTGGGGTANLVAGSTPSASIGSDSPGDRFATPNREHQEVTTSDAVDWDAVVTHGASIDGPTWLNYDIASMIRTPSHAPVDLF